MMGYIQELKFRIEDKDAKDEAYAELDKVKYNGCIRDMLTQIQMHNDKALVSSAAFKKIILDRLLHKILEQMHTVDLMETTDDGIISIVISAGRTAEQWDVARRNLGLKKPILEVHKEFTKKTRFDKEARFDKPKTFKNTFQDRHNTEFKKLNNQSNRKFKQRDKSNKTYAEQTEGIDKSELDRRKPAGECQRCAWPGDRKGVHKTMDCFR